MLKLKNLAMLVGGCAVFSAMLFCLEAFRPQESHAGVSDATTLDERVATLEGQQLGDEKRFLLIDETLKGVETSIAGVRERMLRGAEAREKISVRMGTLRIGVRELRSDVRELDARMGSLRKGLRRQTNKLNDLRQRVRQYHPK